MSSTTQYEIRGDIAESPYGAAETDALIERCADLDTAETRLAALHTANRWIVARTGRRVERLIASDLDRATAREMLRSAHREIVCGRTESDDE